MLSIIMASDLHAQSDMNVLMKYADDSNLLVPAYSDLELSCEFDNVKQWAAQTRMIINLQTNTVISFQAPICSSYGQLSTGLFFL